MAGIYIHIPFCAQKCSYCDFHFSTTFSSYRTDLINALNKELMLRKNSDVIETIYFGGGTPSLLTKEELKGLLETIKQNFSNSSEIEVTLECNPDDCSLINLSDWKELGINRLSIGIQSFDDEQLKWMNRKHSSKQAKEALENAQKVGFTNITVDLIYGLPNLTLAEWEKQLLEITRLPIQHISAYCLTIEEKTVLAKWVKEKKIVPSDNDEQSDQFELLVSTLAQNGFEQYEISNFCREENYSKHNSSYWLGKNFIGIGPSAHGFDGKTRYWNISSNQAYIRSLEKNSLPETIEILSDKEQFNELILLGLRTKWGVDKHQLVALIQPNEEWDSFKNAFIQSGELLESETHFHLTEKGKLRADLIASELFIV
ncbi:MAG: radical SAM family heme chaperone HemW [Fluviicola sp.]